VILLIGVFFIKCFEEHEQIQFWCLINVPTLVRMCAQIPYVIDKMVVCIALLLSKEYVLHSVLHSSFETWQLIMGARIHSREH
jgi:hypothetical protein